ncbi:MAG TPA: hypothetical protein DCF68_02980 [Cyanothece sp. UBA12306]|nr:hypothetical protein [Cyanothece sp. UBA12306]
MNSDNRGWLTRLRQRKILVILASIGLLGGLTVWLLQDTLRGGTFKTVLSLPQAHDIKEGTPLTYRGVEVGKVLSLTPEAKGVAVEVKIWPKDRLIPSQSAIKPLELKGKTVLNITPSTALSTDSIQAKPLDVDCDPNSIICSEKRSQVDKVTPGSILKAVNSLPDVNKNVENIEQNVEDIHTSLKGIDQLSKDVSKLIVTLNKSQIPAKVDKTLVSAERAATDISQLANKIGRLSDTANSLLQEVQQTNTIPRLNSTLTSVGNVADRVDFFIAVNQTNVANTLNNIGETSQELTIIMRQLTNLAKEVKDSQLLEKADNSGLFQNLATISANTAELSNKLIDFSDRLTDPETVLKLQQILDSARTMFENINKITSDVDELTGNPKLREEIRKLIEGLSNLLSSIQLLEEQIAYGESMEKMKNSLNSALPSSSSQQLTPQIPNKESSSVAKLVPVQSLDFQNSEN